MSTGEAPTARARGHAPAVAGSAVAVGGLLVLMAVITGLGFLITRELSDGALGRWDTGVAEWFVAHRTSTFDALTRWGSDLGATITIVGVALVAVVALAIGRRWNAVRFLVLALVMEISVFLSAALLVDRPRPDVPRLDVSPPTTSYPSGHTAAAIVLYVGLALVLWRAPRSWLLRTVIWIVAIALPVAVGLSRVYRGMHYATDVLTSVLLAAGVLYVSFLAVRTREGVAGRSAAMEET